MLEIILPLVPLSETFEIQRLYCAIIHLEAKLYQLDNRELSNFKIQVLKTPFDLTIVIHQEYVSNIQCYTNKRIYQLLERYFGIEAEPEPVQTKLLF